MAQRIGAAASSTEAIGTDGSAAAALGTASDSLSSIGTSSKYFVLTPHAGAFPPTLVFTHWGQTDLFFGGPEMDVSYGELD